MILYESTDAIALRLAKHFLLFCYFLVGIAVLWNKAARSPAKGL